MRKYFLLLIAIIFSLSTTAYADFYSWEDEDGTTHISDTPPPPNKKSPSVKVYKSEEAADTKEATQTDKKKEITVILFTKNECPDCVKAKDFLTAKNIQFTEYNMDTDPNAEAKRKEFDQNTDVPFAVINRTQVYGFSEAVYERALKSTP